MTEKLTEGQLRILNLVLDHRLNEQRWPSLLTIQRELPRTLNVRRELEGLRERYGEHFATRGLEEPITLPLPAIAACGRAEEYYAMMPRIIEASREVFFDPKEKPVLTSQHLLARGWSKEDVAHAGLLLREESPFSRGSGHNPNGEWHVDLSDAIYDFHDVNTPRQYLQTRLRELEQHEARTKNLRRPRRTARAVGPATGLLSGVNLSPAPVRVFIVHGHDTSLKHEVARTTEQLGLMPVVLHERPDRGRTIIEKFEENASEVDFAIILITPDDIFGSDGPARTARARQNVILELGYFLGRIGRERVFILRKHDEDLELPSDYQGVIYTPADEHGAWKLALVKNLQAVGIHVDANDIAR